MTLSRHSDHSLLQFGDLSLILIDLLVLDLQLMLTTFDHVHHHSDLIVQLLHFLIHDPDQLVVLSSLILVHFPLDPHVSLFARLILIKLSCFSGSLLS